MFISTPNPYVAWLKAAAVVAVVAAAGYGVYKVWTYGDSKVEQGVTIGKTEAKVETLKQDNEDLKVAKEAAEAAGKKAAEVQGKYGETQEQYRGLSGRLAAQQRLHNTAIEDLKARVGKADVESCRELATQAADNLSRCRGHVERFGQEAVRASAAAHAAVEAAGDLVVGIPEVEIPVVEIPEPPNTEAGKAKTQKGSPL